MDSTKCPFCSIDEARVFLQSDAFRAIWDRFPVSPGHALIIPRQHISDWAKAPAQIQQELTAAIVQVQAEIDKLHGPDGYNVGFNSGAAAGQTVPHLHVHVIPRYLGDMSDPRGGVRHVIPRKGNYLLQDAAAEYAVSGLLEEQLLTTGAQAPLLPLIRKDIDRAQRVDIAVAFTLNSGLDLLIEHLADLLARPSGKLRFLTGDYLDVTDPVALRRLMDLDGDVETKVFETGSGTGFHPKAYLCHFPDGSGVAYVGSSNISSAALTRSVEWNYRIIRSRDAAGFSTALASFHQLYRAKEVVSVSPQWINNYEMRRKAVSTAAVPDIEPETERVPPKPHPVQEMALEALQRTRDEGNAAGLVVLATGLGKTWLSAFDSYLSGDFDRVLFVAHRDEILTQALNTYRQIRPKATLGRYTGTEKAPNADVLFASVQTLGKIAHLRKFRRDEFDYIVVDEFHHAAAATYRKLIDYFEPKFLLGLTATPERTDGGDLLGLCQENLVFRYDLYEGINSKLLSPFKYFGVPDEVDYENIPWRSRSFDADALEAALATQARAQNALEQYWDKAGEKTLAFCCSQRHADFMSAYFKDNGLRSVAVHSGDGSAPRADSLEKLADGMLDVVCSVDMFNEGVDVPSVDTVMLLRPTESSILWLQQIGRGLRKTDEKDHLTIIDYIGNHRSFLNKPKALLQLGADPNEVRRALKQLRDGAVDLPTGCEVTYDLEALDILESLLPKRPPGAASDVVQLYYEDFRDRMGCRPKAMEVFHDGYDPRTADAASWVSFVGQMGDLSEREMRLVRQHEKFFASLDKTRMVKSYKMVLLKAMLSSNKFPGPMDISELVEATRRVVNRSARLRADFGNSINNDAGLAKLLEDNPIEAWVGAKSTHDKYFQYRDKSFRSTLEVENDDRDDFSGLLRELVEWRLAEYLSRNTTTENEGSIVCSIQNIRGRPMILLPSDDRRSELPHGESEVVVEGERFIAEFGEAALATLYDPNGRKKNILPSILRKWFDYDAGRPGTDFAVELRVAGKTWEIIGPNLTKEEPQLWGRYARERVANLFGYEHDKLWGETGFIQKDNQTFLLVTLDKANAVKTHRYRDYFVDRSTFHWQSQNRTKPTSPVGVSIKEHRDRGNLVHLFVRKTSKERGWSMPFYYCGQLLFDSWEGGETKDEPISVTWKLQNELSPRLFDRFSDI